MPKIAACLIVKNSQDTIERALNSIRPHVDGVFVYDTGSTDDTLSVLDALNRVAVVRDDAGNEHAMAPIVVTQGEWRNDFSWARQQNFDSVPEEYDWMLWLDDDDVVVGAQNLRMLAFTAGPEVDGFVFFYDYARDERGNNVCQLWRERLMRRSAGYVWRNAVHEVLVPEDGHEPRLVTVPPNVAQYVHERPPERYDPSRNLTILEGVAERETIEHGGPLPRTLAYLGTEWMAKGRFDLAVGYLEGYLAHPQAGWSDERSQVRHKLATCLRAMAAPQAAVEVEFQALKERDDWTENAIGLAGAFAELGQWNRAEEWARRALAKGMPQSPLILNPLEHYLLPTLIVADACVNQNKLDEAREAIQIAAERFPIPEVLGKVEQIDQLSKRGELLGAVMLLRETLIRHDENLKAWELMNAVPYLIEDDPLIVHAKAAQRENVMHALEPEEYERWYREEPKESTIEDEWVPVVDQHIERAGFTLEGLREQEEQLGRKPRVLDMGGNDMWMACFLWVQGEYHVDGIELNKQAIEKGIERMKRFGAPGKLVQGNIHNGAQLLPDMVGKYDAVLCYEVLEHVPDLRVALGALEDMCAPGGRVYVTTPAGAFERGNIDRWSVVERKGHLRAVQPLSFAETLSERGMIDDFRVHHHGRLTFARYEPRAIKGDVVFYAGGSFESWSPVQIRQTDEQGRTGLGGSETALAQVATRLANDGYRVRVYSGADEGLYGGALYRPYTSWDPTEKVDLLIVSRLPHVFDNPIGAKRTALWCHDHSYPGLLTEERAAKIDSIVVLSDWQKRRFARLYPFAKSRLKVIRNGISFKDVLTGEPRFDGKRPFGERAPRVVYSSSADRGLDVLLGMWPRIRERVPEAELHVFYGFDVLERVAAAQHDPGLLAFRNSILAEVERQGGEDAGIFLRGRTAQDDLYREFCDARVWGYPTQFLETSCITAMEARAAGLAIVTSGLGALSETAAVGHLINWDADEDERFNLSDEYQDEFVDTVVEYLTDEGAWNEAHQLSLRGAERNDWSRRLDSWRSLAQP